MQELHTIVCLPAILWGNMVLSTDMEAMLPGFNSRLLQVTGCVTLGNYLYLLYLSFLICGMGGMIRVSVLVGYRED